MYWTLALAASGLLGWLWWQQRIQPQPSPQSSRTNDDSRITSDASRLSPKATATNLPIVRVIRTNALGRTSANLGEIVPRIAYPRAAPTQSVTQTVGATLEVLSRTNAGRDFNSPTWLPKEILEVQVALARQGISPGCIDGKYGPQTRAALRAFQARERINLSGDVDARTKALLPLREPTFTTYTVSSNDLSRLMPVGQTWLQKSLQERLDYETILELVAERGHAHPNLIRSLNHGIDWTNVVAGTVVTMPNVRYPVPSAKAAFVRIRLAEKTLEAFDAGTNLLAHFPCSIARRVEKRPVGQLQVEKVATNPNYRFDPEVFPESAEARELGRVLMIPPGPNNPVGTAWIGLDRPGYGIHGTPRPEEVGRTESHGCFRLANWNAEYLLQLISVGTPVLVEP
ncbi:MAG: L,D-transpeptidase [Verrucomicrobiales bacterium]|nr:L,D-transpeptidase [Verrucomicrobiales bacterium]